MEVDSGNSLRREASWMQKRRRKLGPETRRGLGICLTAARLFACTI
jgi:hypothetical protein